MMHRLCAPVGELGSDTGAADRGDFFEPTDDEGDTPELKPEAKIKEPEADADADTDGTDDDDESDADDKSKKREPRIPLSRHKDMLEKERTKRSELEQKLAQYQQGNQVAALNEDITAAENEVLKLEKEYATMLADGEVEKATVLMGKIRSLERSMSEAKSDMKIAAAESRATERARFNLVLERIEQAYPALNPDSDEFDAEVMSDVTDLKASYEARRGLTPTAAMQKAVEKLLGSSTKAQEKVLDTTPRVTTKDVAAERKKDAVKNTLAAVSKTPPSTSKVGMDSDKAGGGLTAKDVMKMSQEDFRKLPEDVLARMRGDDLS